MAGTIREEIGELLRDVGASGAFSARRTAGADDLQIEVKGLGLLRLPVSQADAEQLVDLARPARFGQGEETLLDRRVRDTGEVPKSRVKIDRRRWDRTLVPVLEDLRADLGLPDGCRLRAELHSMLVYGPGQFFLPHQDSEKADEMVGTLVVTLPSTFRGGALVVEHRGERATYRATKKALSFVAFYADCRHEVRPVKQGYRVVLTYNLMAEGDGSAAAEVSTETADALAGLLREHFETPLPPRWAWQKDEPPREPPNRLVYLLDHEYTERGFGWSRLKGEDAARVAAFRAAAERAECETMLALAEIHETWDCLEPGWDEPWYGRRRSWSRDEDDEWDADEEPPLPSADDPDAYDLVDLIESGITLDRWIKPSGKKAEPIATHVGDGELCFTTPSSDLQPYASEYEGYMGNWGNTMDRWYRRAAVVLWPRERTFVVRAEASPAWGVEEIEKCLRAGEATEAREMTRSLLPFWKASVSTGERRGFFAKTLRVAEGVDQRELAASLLEPFWVEALDPDGAEAFAALVGCYGESWVRELLSGWSERDRRWARPVEQDRAGWLPSLPRLTEALCLAEETNGRGGVDAARIVLEDSWAWLAEEIEQRRGFQRASHRAKALVELATPLLAWLESAALVGAGPLLDDAVGVLCSGENEPLVPCLVQTLRSAAETVAPALWPAAGLDRLEDHCVRVLEAQLAKPPRAAGDWSIALPEGCSCELCEILGAFLADSEETRREWPLAKERRKHIHRRIDPHGLPVRHETRRQGRPYTLILTKTEALFKREAADRRAREVDLAWLTGSR